MKTITLIVKNRRSKKIHAVAIDRGIAIQTRCGHVWFKDDLNLFDTSRQRCMKCFPSGMGLHHAQIMWHEFGTKPTEKNKHAVTLTRRKDGKI